jgi:uncharacterized protein YggE
MHMNKQHLAVIAAVAVIGTMMAVPAIMSDQNAQARRHLHITIYGSGEVEVHGHGSAPDVTLDCEPGGFGGHFGWAVRAHCY